jgi:hypothetical protein
MDTFSLSTALRVFVVISLFMGVPSAFGWKIAKRAGLSPISGLCVGIPLVGIVVLWVWASIKWPAQRGPRART